MVKMSGRKILVITPHPDDAESGAGGTIAKWSEEGATVVLIVCTNGNKGTDDRSKSSSEIAEIRRREQADAAKILGITNVIFLDHDDQELHDNDAFRQELVREIRTYRPDVVVTIDPERRWIRHRDHFVTGRVALDAVFPYARDHLAYPLMLDDGLEPHKVKEVYLWGSDEPDVFIDVDGTFDKKVDALYCHVSQMSTSREDGLKRLRDRFSEYGWKVNASVAEPFKLLRLGR